VTSFLLLPLPFLFMEENKKAGKSTMVIFFIFGSPLSLIPSFQMACCSFPER